MEKDILSNLCFTFETTTPKIVQEKWAAFPPQNGNQFASKLFFQFRHKSSQNCSRKMGSISPLEWKIDLPQTYFFTFETKAPEIDQGKWAAFPPSVEN